METKSPASVRSREIIGVEQFSQRREVFDKHDTVFLPVPSPTSSIPVYREVEPIITSNQAKTKTNFVRNGPRYSSMRETTESEVEFRPRKYSDNYTSENNQSDSADYRSFMMERTRRLSKLRREFLNSNLHDSSNDNAFSRAGTRASLPAKSTYKNYKLDNLHLYKFPFAEPFATPPPVRKVLVDLGPTEIDGKENKDPEENSQHDSLPNQTETSQIDHEKLFEELVKRYSPQRKPIDWTLPPTKPRVVGSVPKTNGDQETVKTEEIPKENGDIADSKTSLTELAEKNDKVPELSVVHRDIGREPIRKPSIETFTDLSIPALIEKIDREADLETQKKETKKVKRKRSFIDKLLGRKKNDK